MMDKKGQFFVITLVLLAVISLSIFVNQVRYTPEETSRDSTALSLFQNIKEESQSALNLSVKEDRNGSTVDENLNEFDSYVEGNCDKNNIDCDFDYVSSSEDSFNVSLTVSSKDFYLHEDYSISVPEPKNESVDDEDDEVSLTAYAGSDKYIEPNETVYFSGEDSVSSEGIVSYNWSFGDGVNGGGVTVSHSYLSEGEYEVVLKVVDSLNNTDKDSLDVIVEEETIKAEAGSDKQVSEGEEVCFDGSSSYSSEGNITYYWSFGDGSTKSGVSVCHEYESQGSYEVVLEVEDEEGNTAIDTVVVDVEDSDEEEDDSSDEGDVCEVCSSSTDNFVFSYLCPEKPSEDKVRLRFRVDNNYDRGLSHLSIRVPEKVELFKPERGGTYSSVKTYGIEYTSDLVKFETLDADGIKSGGSDVFELVIPESDLKFFNETTFLKTKAAWVEEETTLECIG